MKQNHSELSDAEVIFGLQRNDRSVEKSFYLSCKSYFTSRKGAVIHLHNGAREDKDIFQDSFMNLWKEIQVKRIYVRDNHAWRIDRHGQGRQMTASLMTYLMSIAKNKNLEEIREQEIYGAKIPDVPNVPDMPEDEKLKNNRSWDTEPEPFTRDWIVWQCVRNLPPRCKEILTLFYYECRSLDEILKIRNENQSKDGLKTGKSKCLKNLTEKVSEQFNRYHLKPYRHEQG